MKRINCNKNLLFSFVLLLVLVIGIAYAYLTSNLSISGTTGIVGNSWDIHFENLNVKEGSVTATSPATIQSNKVDITYSIRLERPKDYYEFTVDVKNDGTLPGKVSISSLSGLDTTSSKIIDYSIKYTNGIPLSIGDILNAGTKKTIKVRVYYKDDISASDLPSSNLNLSLTYTLQYLQSDEDEINAGNLLQNLSSSNTCITKYTGQVTDQPGETVTATNVYFDKCLDKRNIIFGGFCWQAIRTTETGGIKMIYNGEPVDGKCESTRGDHTGIVGAKGTEQTLNSEFLYGNSFTYDTTNNNFTLTDTFLATWSNSTYENLIGKYTCMDTTDTCTTLYYIGTNKPNYTTKAYTSSYVIGSTNYSQIGNSSFNSNRYSIAMAGYMFNESYDTTYMSGSSINNFMFGSSFNYNSETNMYTLSGNRSYISNWSNSYNQINNKHYTCWNTTGTCNQLFFTYHTNSSYLYYIKLSKGKGLNDALTGMISSDNINRYNSSIKGIIDAWYAQNISSKTNMLEDTVYCNNRSILTSGGWSEYGNTTSNYELKFKNDDFMAILSCQNETDQFAVSNNKARLTYPVGMINNEEFYILEGSLSSTDLLTTHSSFWNFSPKYFNELNIILRTVSSTGFLDSYSSADTSYGVRLAISLASDSIISSGTGSETDPWIIKE